MTLFALFLVLTAAVLHATWNLAAKRAGSGGMPFIFLAGIVIVILYTPVLAIYAWIWRPEITGPMLGVIVVSGMLKSVYAVCLQRAYRAGDFSLIYPLARGTGPLLATLIAMVFLGERPSLLALAGGLLIVASIFFLTGGDRWLRRQSPLSGAQSAIAIRYGLLSGCFIATYTVWDRFGVSRLHIPPIVFDGGTAITTLALLAPFAWPRRAAVREQWRIHRREALVMAVFSSTGYVLVLTAMKFTPVSYVAPAREFSILFGAVFGAKLLGEAESPRRLRAAAGMVIGLIALALG